MYCARQAYGEGPPLDGSKGQKFEHQYTKNHDRIELYEISEKRFFVNIHNRRKIFILLRPVTFSN